jgi:hypothetical protein
MVISVILLIINLVGGLGLVGYAQTEGALLGIVLSCIPALFFLFGVLAGAMLAFARGAVGKVLASIYWAILLIGTICGGLFGFLVIGGPGLFQ